MAVKVYSCLQQGIEGKLVEVEVDILQGLSAFSIVGLGDIAVQEAKERIRSALKNSGVQYPQQKKVINLAPADLRKHGPHFDLPMAVGLFVAAQKLGNNTLLADSLIVGELALDGSIKAVAGIVSIALFAKRQGWKRLIMPKDNMAETVFIQGIEIVPFGHLNEVIHYLHTGEKPMYSPKETLSIHEIIEVPAALQVTFDDIKGHEYPKRALQIAAAGGHHVLLSGSPGVGKTLLAKAFTSILPPLTEEEMFEVLQIYSAAGLLHQQDISKQLVRPFREVHSSCSLVSLTGGGKFLRPGEISLAHRGVLFLDEIAEFPRQHLESLRQPLESKTIHISRAFGTIQYPAQFTLIASMNPCPCGYAQDSQHGCNCTSYQVIQYQKKLSGPLLDRIDLTLEVTKQSMDHDTPSLFTAGVVLETVTKARKIQQQRFKNTGILTNTEMAPALIKRYCELDIQGSKLMAHANEKLQLSGRQYHQILKTARTIADLQEHSNIQAEDLAEALQYRQRPLML